MSRQELSDKSGVPIESIESLLRGKDNLDLKTISQIEKALNVEILIVNRPYVKIASSIFLIQELDLLAKMFPDISIRYTYENCLQYHVVGIEPLECLEKDKGFVDWCLGIYKKFDSKFKEEDLLISEWEEIEDMSNLLYSYPSEKGVQR